MNELLKMYQLLQLWVGSIHHWSWHTHILDSKVLRNRFFSWNRPQLVTSTLNSTHFLNLFRFHFPSYDLAVILWACRKFPSLRRGWTVDSVYTAEDCQGIEVKEGCNWVRLRRQVLSSQPVSCWGSKLSFYGSVELKSWSECLCLGQQGSQRA